MPGKFQKDQSSQWMKSSSYALLIAIPHAMQHASDNDPVSKDYIRSLASLIQIDSILNLDEGAASSKIF